MDKSFEIADIIVAFIKGEATPQQIMELDAWMSESEDNRYLFVSLLDESAFERRREAQDAAELEETFKKLRTRKVRGGKRYGLRYIAVAASVVVLMMVGGVYWMNIPERHGVVARQEGISVGKSKAFLTLGTGEKIFLEKQDTILQGFAMNIQVQEQGLVCYEITDRVFPAEMEYNTLETPHGAEFQLVLSDGTRVWLNAGSKLRYPVNFVGKERRVQLTGEAYFDVYRNEKVPFVVATSRSEVSVLGTEFCVRDYAGQTNQTTLVNGRVAVRDCKGSTHVIEPGQQVNIDGDSVRVSEVETIYFTSWKDGYFVFNQATLSEIMSELSKWYDFDCFFIHSSTANTRLTARLKKYDDIDVILDILSRTGDVHFLQKGRVITVGSMK